MAEVVCCDERSDPKARRCGGGSRERRERGELKREVIRHEKRRVSNLLCAPSCLDPLLAAQLMTTELDPESERPLCGQRRHRASPPARPAIHRDCSFVAGNLIETPRLRSSEGRLSHRTQGMLLAQSNTTCADATRPAVRGLSRTRGRPPGLGRAGRACRKCDSRVSSPSRRSRTASRRSRRSRVRVRSAPAPHVRVR
jgi:hypothetical protein